MAKGSYKREHLTGDRLTASGLVCYRPRREHGVMHGTGAVAECEILSRKKKGKEKKGQRARMSVHLGLAWTFKNFTHHPQ